MCGKPSVSLYYIIHCGFDVLIGNRFRIWQFTNKKTLAYNIIGIMKGYSQIHIILPGEGRYKLYPSN